MVLIEEDIQIVSNPFTRKAKKIASEFTHPVVLRPAFLHDHIPSSKCSLMLLPEPHISLGDCLANSFSFN